MEEKGRKDKIKEEIVSYISRNGGTAKRNDIRELVLKLTGSNNSSSTDKYLKELMEDGILFQSFYGKYDVKEKFRISEVEINIRCPRCKNIFLVNTNEEFSTCSICNLEILKSRYQELIVLEEDRENDVFEIKCKNCNSTKVSIDFDDEKNIVISCDSCGTTYKERKK
jgi:Zn finger protein HypA/HybF involved in hydrogenase expression